MKITTNWKMNLKTKEAKDRVNKAGRQGLLDTVTDIANYAIKNSPYLTGNNARMIMFEVGPGGAIAKTDKQGAVYSTSGYGGFLETGTVRMPARPYIKPGYDLYGKGLPMNIKVRLR